MCVSTQHAYVHITHTHTEQDFLENAARDQINQKYLSYFIRQCYIAGAAACYVIFILVSASLALFSKCHQSHFIIFRFLLAVTLGIRVTVGYHSSSQPGGLCGSFISQAWRAVEKGDPWVHMVLAHRNSILHLLRFLPLPQRSFLLFIRHEISLNLNVNTSTQVWPWSLIFHFMKNRAKEAEHGFF